MAQLSLDRIGQIAHLITSKTFNETPLYLPDRGAFCQVLVAAALFADLVVLDSHHLRFVAEKRAAMK
jgi:hypothetical protein